MICEPWLRSICTSGWRSWTSPRPVPRTYAGKPRARLVDRRGTSLLHGATDPHHQNRDGFAVTVHRHRVVDVRRPLQRAVLRDAGSNGQRRVRTDWGAVDRQLEGNGNVGRILDALLCEHDARGVGARDVLDRD